MDIPPVPFFFRIRGAAEEGLLYVALEKENETTYYCLGSRKLSISAKDGKTVWRIEQENGMGAYYDRMPVESMETIYTDIQPMSARNTRAFIRENNNLLHSRHVDKLYTDGNSYWYTPKAFYKPSIKIRSSTSVRSAPVKKSSRVSKSRLSKSRLSKYTRVSKSKSVPHHKTSL